MHEEQRLDPAIRRSLRCSAIECGSVVTCGLLERLSSLCTPQITARDMRTAGRSGQTMKRKERQTDRHDVTARAHEGSLAD